jgi:hypothetical protein
MFHYTTKFYQHSSAFYSKKDFFLLTIFFSSFNLQENSQVLLNDFLNSVGQLKYRGTSVLFRLHTHAKDLLRMHKSVYLIKLFTFFLCKENF